MKHRLVLGAVTALVCSVIVSIAPGAPVAAVPIEDRVLELLIDIDTNAVGLQSRSIAVSGDSVYFELSEDTATGEASSLMRVDAAGGDPVTVFSDPQVTNIRVEAALAGRVLFTAFTEATGTELWVHDESSGTTELLGDLTPGDESSSVRDFVLGDRIYFVAIDEAGAELWATKGTPDSTERVVDLNPGPAWSDPRGLVVVPTGPSSQALFFRAEAPATGSELFRFDEGVGVTPIEINVGGLGSSTSAPLLADDGAVYFTAQEAGTSKSAYRIASPSATPGADVADELAMGPQTGPQVVQATQFTVVGETLYVRVQTGSAASLWKTVGSTGTPEIVVESFFGRSLVDAGGGLLFQQQNGGFAEIGVSDGSASGTVIDETVARRYNEPVLRGDDAGVLFTTEATDGSTGSELWFSAGVAGTTSIVLDVRPGPIGSSARIITDGGDAWFFLADDGVTGQQLWTTDGTTAGTQRLTSLGLDAGASSDPRYFVEAGDTTFFTAGVEKVDNLWAHDRTTGIVSEITAPGGEGLLVGDAPFAYGDGVLFAGSGDDSGYELWRSDGTSAGTERLNDTDPGPDSGSPRNFLLVGDSVLFEAADRLWVLRPGDSSASELSSADWEIGAAIGRTLIASGCNPDCGVYAINIDAGAATVILADRRISRSATFGGVMYFVEEEDDALYRTDGTAAGTTVVSEMVGIRVDGLAATSTQLVIAADIESADPGDPVEPLYVIGLDGMVRPVALPADLDPLQVGLGRGSLALADGSLLASARRAGHFGGGGMRLVAPGGDGTLLVSIDGAELVVVAEFPGQEIGWIGVYDGQVYLVTNTVSGGRGEFALVEPGAKLWRTDGTGAGTEVVVDFAESGVTAFFGAVVADGLLYGLGETLATGAEPFTFDLTAEAEPEPEAETDIVSLEPGRVLDTRASGETVDDLFEKTGKLAADSFVEVDVAGRAGVPDDVAAVVLNVTMIRPDGNGFVTSYPCGERPLASSMNASRAGVVVANEVIAKVSSSGSVCLYSSVGTNLAADVTGYVPADSRVVSLEPGRVLDTRASGETVDDLFEKTGKLAADSFVEVDVAGRAGVPDDVAAVVLNVTMIRPDGNGFVTSYPCGERPLASSMNASRAGVVVANEVIAKVSSSGSVCLYSSVGTNLAADVTGYVPADSDVVSLDPARLLDTRSTGETADDLFAQTGRLVADTEIELDVVGRQGVPDSAVAVVLNVTMIRPDGNGFVTIYPCDVDRPLASSMNAPRGGGVVANEVIAKVSATGTVCLYASVGTHLAADLTGYVAT